MKVTPPLRHLAALAAAGVLLSVGTVATLAQGGRLATRPLTHQEIHDYHLAEGTQPSGGLFTVGIGQPLYLEAQVDSGTVVSGVAWAITKRPAGSTANFSSTPITEEMPIYSPGDREVHDVAGRTLLLPDVEGQYQITATVTTDQGEVVLAADATAAKYVGVGTVGSGNLEWPQCALCHPDKTEGWAATGHATMFSEAIDGLKSSHYNEGCIDCHTVGFDPTPGADNDGFDDIATLVGWTFPEELVPGNWDAMDPALQAKANIQCENCHGPGSQHFGRVAGAAISVSTSSGDCGQCHDEKPYHSKNLEWNNSRHAVATRYPTGEGRGSCVGCHSGIGFIDRVDEAEEYRTDYEAIVCAACHDPHALDNPHQLRTVADVTLGNGEVVTEGGMGKLCMQCHKGRRNAKDYAENNAPSSHFGPHYGTQGDMLAGKNAYEYDRPIRSSGHIYAVEDSCVTCHLQEVSYNDPEFTHVGGHTFKPSWDGGTPDDPSDDVHLTGSCASCHGELESFDSIMRQDYDGNGVVEGVQTEVHHLIEQLGRLLPPYGSPEVDIGAIKDRDELKAAFNWEFIHEDGSYGVHNTLYATDLLKVTISELTGQPIAGDADNDCLVDSWEIEHFGDITSYDGLADPDFDGLNNKQEYAAQTMPMVADSDSDGFSDLAELHIGTDPNNSEDTPELGRSTIYPAAEMVFMTEAGMTYQVQALADLGDTQWVNYGEPFEGTGEAMQLFMSTRETQKSFYRVVETQ